MQALADAELLRSFLKRVARRRDRIACAEGAGGGFVVAACVSMLLSAQTNAFHIIWPAALLVTAGAAGRLWHARARQPSAAQLVEARVPACANTVRTASELMVASGAGQRWGMSASGSPRSVSPRVGSLVFHEAARHVRDISIPELIPSRLAAIALSISVVLWALSVARDAPSARTVRLAVQTAVAPNIARIDGMVVTVTPPAYTGRAAVVLPDSARIVALAGSRVSLAVQGYADSLRVETLSGVQTLAPESTGKFALSMTTVSDGFVALQPLLNGRGHGARRLIGMSVSRDEAPRVRITKPARDVRLNSPDTTLGIAITSEDDIGLASLRLRYTKVSGSGERFTFDEGEIPVRITRVSDRQWTGQAQWLLSPLKLEAGDLVVFRAVTTDNRPGSPGQESDALIAEMQTIGGEAAAGFDMDEEFERYAVSQAMVVLRTERLIAAMSNMSRDSIARAAQSLALEQRKVRAEFVFMMGGELADEHGHEGDLNDLGEEAEAEAEGDILAGRLENQGRIALMRAVRAMSRASTALDAIEVSTALVSEKQALTNIQLAFSRSRILLRALSQREALDLTRRLSGDLSEARSVRRATVLAEVDSQTASLQTILARLATVAGSAATADELSMLAQRLLQHGATSERAREIAALLAEASTAASRGKLAEARLTAEHASLALAQLLRERLPNPGRAASRGQANRLEGAFADVLREQRAVPDYR